MKRIAKLMLTGVAVLAIGALQAKAITVYDLTLPGASIQIGDKLFSDWTFNGPNRDAVAQCLALTTVGPGQTIAGPNYGFQLGCASLMAPAGLVYDWQLTYTVTVVPGSPPWIADIEQLFSGGPYNDGAVSISETVQGDTGGAANSTVSITTSWVDPADPAPEKADHLWLVDVNGDYLPAHSVDVWKDIRIVGGDHGAEITLIRQTFSQVPDGGVTVALLGGALAVIGVLRRRS